LTQYEANAYNHGGIFEADVVKRT